MSSKDPGGDIPPTSRIDQVGEEILQEQARRALTNESLDHRLVLIPQPSIGPQTKPGQSTFDGNKITVLPPQADTEDTGITDKVADKIHPGLGHIGPSDHSNRWRFDYLDTGHCSKSGKFGMCFQMRWR